MSTILLIDDEQILRTRLKRILEKEGHQVFEASDGRKGIEAYKNLQTDIVITDIIMPKKEGLETIHELQTFFPESKIIAYSGGGRGGYDGYLSLAKEFGAKRVFKKPFSLDEFLEAVNELVAAG